MNQHRREYLKDYRKKNRERMRVYMKDYHRKHMLFVDGHWVKVNKRDRPPNDVCEVCGETVKRLDYHHWDDTTPEKGIWVCRRCHYMAYGIDRGFGDNYSNLKRRIAQWQETTTNK